MTDAIIQTNALTKHYEKLVAVDSATLEVPPGCVFALMGQNGAGKTSLIKMLLGLTPITGGNATVLGLDSGKLHVEIRRRVGYVPEEHHMYRWMTVDELMRFTSAFYPTWDADLCSSLIKMFGLDSGKKVSELSRGMVAKVALTLALAHRPQLLVLDEPTSGLDAVVRREFLESIVDVAADEGRTVLISSHLLNDVERVTDRIAFMVDGQIRFVEDVEALKERVRELRITFAGQPPADWDVPGCVSMQKGEHEWGCVVDNFGPDTLGELESVLPGAQVRERALGLEEIFVALASPARVDAEGSGQLDVKTPQS